MLSAAAGISVRRVSVRSATTEDLPAVLPLVRAYCEFYETTPEQAPDAGLEEMCRALIAAPEDQGMLLVAEDESGEVVGFAAVGWKWSSLRAARVAILEDLFVSPDARGGGFGRELIFAVADRARESRRPEGRVGHCDRQPPRPGCLRQRRRRRRGVAQLRAGAGRPTRRIGQQSYLDSGIRSLCRIATAP